MTVGLLIFKWVLVETLWQTWEQYRDQPGNGFYTGPDPDIGADMRRRT